MSRDADTLPTTQNLLERIEALAAEMRAGFSSATTRLAVIERQLGNMDMRFDGMESFAHQTRSEVLALRKEFKEFRLEFSDFRSELKDDGDESDPKLPDAAEPGRAGDHV